jgi:hypothetical protein
VLHHPFCLRYLQLRCLPFNAEGNLLSYSVSIKTTPAPLLAKPYTPKQRCTLGNVEALACKDARSDHAVLDFLCTFFIKKKGANKNHL